jgi:hypothetical protein
MRHPHLLFYMKFFSSNSPLNASSKIDGIPLATLGDNVNVRPKNGRNSSPLADCNSRSDTSRACRRSRVSEKLSRYATILSELIRFCVVPFFHVFESVPC